MKNIWRSFWKNIEKIGLGVSILFSIIALYISIRSCSDSNDALKMTKEEFQSKRILILQSSYSNFSPGFKLESINDNQILRKVNFVFPDYLFSEIIALNSPDFQVSLSELQDKLIIMLDSSYASIIKSNNFQINGLLIPLIIESEYIAESSIYKDLSLYNLEFRFINNLANNDRYLNFDNLSFVKRLDDIDGIKTNLDVILGQNLNNIKITYE